MSEHREQLQPPDYDAEERAPFEDEYPDEYGDGSDDRCFHCGGDGEVECDDWLQCTRAHRVIAGNDDGGPWQLHKCSSCGGSGLAKDMTIW